ncbi:DEAD-box ATP-dependent RNA helicase 21 [Acorus gramineus]|uniref:DEAD-box ATP-dependent RNA helicase 21 n=1 Tax=Acorus gramineus TaxID=55184 RepID=A0AAV9ADP7_ACOGR|nr:DEAD-box ATP-dependent RNA helicase 21 [Acorus gramineus]
MVPNNINTQKRLRPDSATGDVPPEKKKRVVVHTMSLLQWGILCKDNGIKFKGLRADRPRPEPIHHSWFASGLRSELIRAVDPTGDRGPLPMQMVAVPLGVQARDLIALCAPVSSKISAYLLPMLQHISQSELFERRRRVWSPPLALVVVPNRDLAEKVVRVMKRLSHDLRHVMVSSIMDDGLSIKEHALELRRGSHVVVGTVGQLGKCLLETRLLMMKECGYLIMDEPDNMMRTGFDKEIEAILKAMPRWRRTIHMYTETMPMSLERLAKKYLRGPINVSVDKAVSMEKALQRRAAEKVQK